MLSLFYSAVIASGAKQSRPHPPAPWRRRKVPFRGFRGRLLQAVAFAMTTW